MSSRQVADFVTNLRYEDLPANVVVMAKTAIKDVIGVSLAAHRDEAVATARRMAMARGQKNEASLIGLSTKVPCETAAFANSVAATTLDMDDGSMGSRGHLSVHRGHPGGILVPAAMAVAQRQQSSGKKLIEAVVAGYEVALLTAWLYKQTVLAAVTGCYGAAAAAAKLFNLAPQPTMQTFNIVSAHSPQPSYAFIWTRIDMSKEAPAWAALTAVMAAVLAESGFRATPGYYEYPEHDRRPFDSLGNEWEILDLYFKQYSACRHAHAAIDGVLKMQKENNLHLNNIEKIIVGCAAKKGLNMNNKRPTNIWQAQYSIPFLIGAALKSGKVGPNQVNDGMLQDEDILEMSDKVELVADQDVEKLQPGALAARVQIRTSNEGQYETFITHPKGDPENPFTDKELETKFNELTFPIIGEKKAFQISSCIENLDKLKDINDLLEMMIVNPSLT